MKSATVAQLKKELADRPAAELMALCLRLAKFKKENKELLTYLLFDALDEEAYIASVKSEIADQLASVRGKNYYWMRKGVRKALKELKKYIRYSLKKETEVELLLDFCQQLQQLKPAIQQDRTLQNILARQLLMANKALIALHEDLQFDFRRRFGDLIGEDEA